MNTSATDLYQERTFAGGDIEAAARAAEIDDQQGISHRPPVRRVNGVA